MTYFLKKNSLKKYLKISWM